MGWGEPVGVKNSQASQEYVQWHYSIAVVSIVSHANSRSRAQQFVWRNSSLLLESHPNDHEN